MKKTKKTKMRILILTSLLVLLSLLAGACSSKATLSVPEGFVLEDVKAQVREVVTLMSNQDFEAVVEQFSPELKAVLDANGLKASVGGMISALGAFKQIDQENIMASKNNQIGDFAVAIIVCSYEKGKATYTISIDDKDQIVGLYMK